LLYADYFGEIIVGGAGFMHIWRDKKRESWVMGLALKPRF
jgi:hypothetical protein